VIRIGTFEELATMLNTNAIDLLWTFDTEIVIPEWIREYEFTNPISIIASASHPLAGAGNLKLKDLADEPFILTEKICSYRDLFEQQFRAQDMDLKVFLEIGNTEIIKKFVGTGIALSVLPAFSLHEELEQGNLCILPVTDFDLQMKGQVFCHRNKWITPEITEFIRLIKEKVPSSYLP
jgi:DNA-binding transcriptional LysR family regulator